MRPFQEDIVGNTASSTRLKAINRLMALREDTRLNKLSAEQTYIIHSDKQPGLQAKATRPLLPLDTAGRPYLMIKDPGKDTLSLVKDLVKGYISFQQDYPAEVLLSALRYLVVGSATHYKLGEMYIPLRFEIEPFDEHGFDVMVRGERIDVF